tara:strand:+ start:659 stop:976 length:318 start_codon:yes stop_codon:yes gene_type:complete
MDSKHVGNIEIGHTEIANGEETFRTLDTPEIHEYLEGIVDEMNETIEEKQRIPQLMNVPQRLVALAGQEKGHAMADLYLLGMIEYSVNISISDQIQPVVEYSGPN